ncbi:hypothetical protein GXN35_RS19150 [Escherichia coli]
MVLSVVLAGGFDCVRRS